jgi:hypothetical protein
MRQLPPQVGAVALLVVALFVVGVGGVAAASEDVSSQSSEISVAVEPADQTVAPGETAAYDVVVEGATEGIGAHDLTVELSDSSVGSFDSFDYAHEPLFDNTEVTDSQLTLSAAMGDNIIAGADRIVLGTATVSGDAEGETNLSVADGVAVSDANDQSYAVGATAGGTLAVASEIDIGLEPAQQTVDAGSTTAYDVVVEGATEGIGAYEASVSLSDDSVASFESFAHANDPMFDNTEVTDNELVISAATGDNTIAGAEKITLGTATVAGTAGGQTDLAVGAVNVTDVDDTLYGVGAVTGGSLEVVNEIDVSLAPAEQTTDAGTTTTYDVVVEGATSGVGAYELTVALSDSSVATFDSFEHASEPLFDNTEVTDSELNISAAMGNNTIAGAETITLGTVTVAGEAEGQAALSVADGVAVTDVSDQRYGVGATAGGSLTVEAVTQTATVDIVPQADQIRAGGETTLDVVVSGEAGISAYDMDITLDSPTTGAAFVDYELTAEGSNGPLDNSAISSDGSSIALDAALLEATHGPGETVVAELTLDIERPGPIQITPTQAEIIDTESRAYDTELNATSVTAVGPPQIVETGQPQDLTGDGLYEDVRGDGQVSVLDVQTLFNHIETPAVQNNAAFFDFSGNSPDQVTILDVQDLFNRVGV